MIEIASGKVIPIKYKSEKAFCVFHHINTYEEDGKVWINIKLLGWFEFEILLWDMFTINVVEFVFSTVDSRRDSPGQCRGNGPDVPGAPQEESFPAEGQVSWSEVRPPDRR